MNPFFLGLNKGYGFGLCDVPWGGLSPFYGPLLGFGGSSMYASLFCPMPAFGFGGTRIYPHAFMTMPAMVAPMPCCSIDFFMPQLCMDSFVRSSDSPGGGGGGGSQTVSDAEGLCQKWSKKTKESVKITPEFCQKVIDISREIKCNSDDLMALMFNESGLDPSSPGEVKYIDKTTGETKIQKNVGLIQFGSQSRSELGFPGDSDEEKISNILNMSAMDQLDYVKKFFIRAKEIANIPPGETISTGTLAALAFAPARAKQEILATDGELAYNNNKNLDKDDNKKITKTELADRLNNLA